MLKEPGRTALFKESSARHRRVGCPRAANGLGTRFLQAPTMCCSLQIFPFDGEEGPATCADAREKLLDTLTSPTGRARGILQARGLRCGILRTPSVAARVWRRARCARSARSMLADPAAVGERILKYLVHRGFRGRSHQVFLCRERVMKH